MIRVGKCDSITYIRVVRTSRIVCGKATGAVGLDMIELATDVAKADAVPFIELDSEDAGVELVNDGIIGCDMNGLISDEMTGPELVNDAANTENVEFIEDIGKVAAVNVPDMVILGALESVVEPVAELPDRGCTPEAVSLLAEVVAFKVLLELGLILEDMLDKERML